MIDLFIDQWFVYDVKIIRLLIANEPQRLLRYTNTVQKNQHGNCQHGNGATLNLRYVAHVDIPYGRFSICRSLYKRVVNLILSAATRLIVLITSFVRIWRKHKMYETMSSLITFRRFLFRFLFGFYRNEHTSRRWFCLARLCRRCGHTEFHLENTRNRWVRRWLWHCAITVSACHCTSRTGVNRRRFITVVLCFEEQHFSDVLIHVNFHPNVIIALFAHPHHIFVCLLTRS